MEVIDMDKSFVHLKGEGSMLASTQRFGKGAYTVSFFHLTAYQQSHPDYWELHPNGDEVIFLLAGKIHAELMATPDSSLTSDSSKNITKLAIGQGQAVIIPRGIRHRLLLIEESKMIVITRIEGTKHIPVD